MGMTLVSCFLTHGVDTYENGTTGWPKNSFTFFQLNTPYF